SPISGASTRSRSLLMFLLDTNVVSDMRKVRTGRADARFMRWAESIVLSDHFLSAVSVEELEQGVLLTERRDPRQGALLRAWLDGYVLPQFGGRVLPVDVAVAKLCARLQVPDPRPLADSYIAATALVHGMTVVTRDVIDFTPMGVS